MKENGNQHEAIDQKLGNVLFNTTTSDIPLHVTYIHFEHRASHGTAMPDSCFGCNYKSHKVFLSIAQLNCYPEVLRTGMQHKCFEKIGKVCFSEQSYW